MRLFSNPPPLTTTSLVLAEGHGWFLKRYDRTKALQFLAMVECISPLELTSTGTGEIEAAMALMRRFSDQDLTLVDSLGLYTMDARRIRMCWSTDHHLGLMGVPLVIHTK